MIALIGAFNEEKALVGAFSVIMKTGGSFAALPVTVSGDRLSDSAALTGAAQPEITVMNNKFSDFGVFALHLQ